MESLRRILRLVISIEHTSAPYNQFTLPALGNSEIGICAFFSSDLIPDKRIPYFSASGNSWRYFRLIQQQLLCQPAYDVVHLHSVHVAIFFLAAALTSRTNMIRKSVIHIHTSYTNYTWRNKLLAMLCFAFIPRIVCCSQSSRESFPKLFHWLAGKRLKVIPNGVHIDRVDHAKPSARLRQNPTDGLQILSVGALRPLKNHCTVIRGFADANLENATLTIIGGGDLKEDLELEAKRLGIEKNVRLLGILSRDETLAHMWSSDVFVSMSYCEGLPVAVMEAMAASRPVLLSMIPPHRELAEGVEGAILLDTNDFTGLAHHLNSISIKSRTDRNNLGNTCRHFVETRYSLKQMLAAYENLFDELVDTKCTNLLPSDIPSRAA
jgi:glycosyltransferase involved in cell wall biosynthesis